MDLAENAQLRRQVDMLQKYLSTVLEHSEIEVQDHQISERIWNKEKSQLQEQIRILQGKSGNVADNAVSPQASGGDEFKASNSELEESIIRLTKERDELRESVKTLRSQLNTVAIDGLNDRKNNYDEAPSDQNSNNTAGTSASNTNGVSVTTDEEEDTEGNIDNINRSESKVTEKRVLARIIDENTELNNRIDIYDKQLEDAKVAVLKASMIQKLNKDIDHERKRKKLTKPLARAQTKIKGTLGPAKEQEMIERLVCR